MVRLFCDSLSQQNSVKGKSGEINALVSVIHDHLRQSSASRGRQKASVTSKATGEPHVGHVRMRPNDRTAVKVIVVVVYGLTVHHGGFFKPEETPLDQLLILRGLNQPFKSVLQDGEYLVFPVVGVDIAVYVERNVRAVRYLAHCELTGVALPPDEDTRGVAGQRTVEARPGLVSVHSVEITSPSVLGTYYLTHSLISGLTFSPRESPPGVGRSRPQSRTSCPGPRCCRRPPGCTD